MADTFESLQSDFTKLMVERFWLKMWLHEEPTADSFAAFLLVGAAIVDCYTKMELLKL